MGHFDRYRNMLLLYVSVNTCFSSVARLLLYEICLFDIHTLDIRVKKMYY